MGLAGTRAGCLRTGGAPRHSPAEQVSPGVAGGPALVIIQEARVRLPLHFLLLLMIFLILGSNKEEEDWEEDDAVEEAKGDGEEEDLEEGDESVRSGASQQD